MSFTKHRISDVPKINFLVPPAEKGVLIKPKAWRFFVGRFFAFFIVLMIFIFLGFTSKILISSSGLSDNFGKRSFWGQIKGLIAAEDKYISGAGEDRINLLLLGVGGPGHIGPYLSDTIMLLSLKPSTNEAAVISIPRDLYVPIPGFGKRKINNAYAFGFAETQDSETGASLAKSAIEDIFAVPVHYYVVVDFQGVEDLVDAVGGLDIYVEKDLYDESFPTDDFGVTTIAFEKGWHKLDGEEALQYARSRQSTSDFDRAKRQQQILVASKNKILNYENLFRPDRVSKLLKVLDNNLATDLEVWQIVQLAKIAKSIKSKNIIHKVLDNGPYGVLTEIISEDGAFLLFPRSGDWQELQNIARNIFDLNEAAEERARIIVQNGTKTPSLASNLAASLSASGFNIAGVENALEQNEEKTFIYDLSQGRMPKTLQALQKELSVSAIPSYVPLVFQGREGEVDVVVVLGEDNGK